MRARPWREMGGSAPGVRARLAFPRGAECSSYFSPPSQARGWIMRPFTYSSSLPIVIKEYVRAPLVPDMLSEVCIHYSNYFGVFVRCWVLG